MIVIGFRSLSRAGLGTSTADPWGDAGWEVGSDGIWREAPQAMQNRAAAGFGSPHAVHGIRPPSG
jgi:hypothetical protein